MFNFGWLNFFKETKNFTINSNAPESYEKKNEEGSSHLSGRKFSSINKESGNSGFSNSRFSIYEKISSFVSVLFTKIGSIYSYFFLKKMKSKKI